MAHGENKRAKVGGEAGIRTLDTGFGPYNGLANRRLQPLGHLTGAGIAKYNVSAPEGLDGIGPGRPAGRDVAREQRDADNGDRGREKRHRVVGTEAHK